MSDIVLPILAKSAAEMRAFFNSAGLWERARTGDLTQVTRRDSHPAEPPPGHPSCTRTQLIEYFDQRTRVAIVHQYLRPDGALGGSGRPDPKWLLVGSEIWSSGRSSAGVHSPTVDS